MTCARGVPGGSPSTNFWVPASTVPLDVPRITGKEHTIQSGEAGSDGVEWIVDGKAETGIEHIDGEFDRRESVHEVRKRCVKVCATLRLVRAVLPPFRTSC